MMKRLLVVLDIALAGFVGCMTAKEKIAAEYQRISTLPPAERVVCGCDKAIDDLGGAVCDAHNFAREKLIAYVKATENHREYIGFMNDIELLVKQEGLSNEDAVRKLQEEILKEDAVRVEADRVWPRIVEGIIAAEALEPAVMLLELVTATDRNADLIVSATRLRGSINGFDSTTLVKIGAMKDIVVQGVETAECLTFLAEQFRRVQVAKYYVK